MGAICRLPVSRMPVMEDLPTEVPCPWSGDFLRLKYALPKIWTQTRSRAFGIYWSDALSYGRLWPEPTESELKSFYDLPGYNEYLSGKSSNEFTEPSLLARAVMKIAWLNDHGIVDSLPTILSLTKKRPTVCDLGCGSGTFLSRMRDHSAIPVGVDPSSVSAEAVRLRDIEFHSGSAETLPDALSDRRFDVVSMFQSLEHCRDPAQAISNALSLLQPDGLLVIDFQIWVALALRNTDQFGGTQTLVVICNFLRRHHLRRFLDTRKQYPLSGNMRAS